MLVAPRDGKPTRNDVQEFGRRTRRNLEFIETAKQNDPDARVHVVTQLTLSLLGIVIFPYEKRAELKQAIFDKTIAEIQSEGWLGWSITLDRPTRPKNGRPPKLTTTLEDLLRHVRNAAVHGGLTFSTDSASVCEVAVTAEDKPGKKDEINWRAEIEASELRTFCFRFLEFVNGIVA